MCFGLLLALPHILFINLLINSLLTRIVLYTYILLFFVPIFALNSWLIGFDFVYIFFYVELFFVTILFGYFLFIGFFQLISVPTTSKILPKSFIQAPEKSKNNYSSIIFFILISILFCIYFYILNPEYSGLLSFLEGGDGVPRFAIYSAPNGFQLIYALYGRILAPLAIFLAPSRKSRIFVLVIALVVLLNSIERQTIVILTFTYVATLFLKETRWSLFDLIGLVISLAGLFGVIIMQGNVVIEINIFEALPLGLQVIFSRIFLDPLYMLHHILFFFQDMQYTYGATNRLLTFIGLNYIAGFSAIGIIADGHLAFGVMGVIFAGLWYSFVLALCSRIAKNSRKTFAAGISKILLLIACISFFYSNTFSTIPLLIIIVVIFPYLVIKVFGAQK